MRMRAHHHVTKFEPILAESIFIFIEVLLIKPQNTTYNNYMHVHIIIAEGREANNHATWFWPM